MVTLTNLSSLCCSFYSFPFLASLPILVETTNQSCNWFNLQSESLILFKSIMCPDVITLKELQPLNFWRPSSSFASSSTSIAEPTGKARAKVSLAITIQSRVNHLNSTSQLWCSSPSLDVCFFNPSSYMFSSRCSYRLSFISRLVFQTHVWRDVRVCNKSVVISINERVTA